MLKGGTAGQQSKQDESGANFGSFTHAGVKTIYASPKKQYDVRILPAFDMSLNLEDDAFSKSFVSYRDANEEQDEDTGSEAFSPWFYMVHGHTYFGLGRRQFLSPLTGTQFYPEGHDPIRDTWKYIDKYVDDMLVKQLAHGKTVLDEASKKEKKLPGYLSKTPRQFALMNVLVEGETRGTWDNAVLICSQTTIKDLKMQLSIQTKRSDNVIVTPEWEDYYYGDITDPKRGCITRVMEKNIANSNGGTTRTCGFYPDQAPDDDANHKMIVHPVTEADLMKRYRIFDTENVTNLPDKETQYQVILDYLVEDGVVPLNILEVACGKYGKVDPTLRKKAAAWFEGEAPIEDDGQTKSAGTGSKPASSGGQNALKSPPSAVDALAQSKKEESKAVTKEDVPMEDKPPTSEPDQPKTEEAPKTEEKPSEGATEGADPTNRFEELQNKLKNNEPLSPEELQELGELARAQG